MWRKSSFCNGAATCIEVEDQPDLRMVLINDSKDPDGTCFWVSYQAWTDFIDAIKEQRLQLHNGVLTLKPHGDDWVLWCASHPRTLHFTSEEVSVFVAGVCDGQFDVQEAGV